MNLDVIKMCRLSASQYGVRDVSGRDADTDGQAMVMLLGTVRSAVARGSLGVLR
jgi:hypothetical protein